MSRSTRDSYQPQYRQQQPVRPTREPMYRFGGAQRGRSDFSFRSRIAERDLLTHFPSSVETPVLASNHTSHRFRDVDNLTDSDEEVMDEGSSDAEGGRVKRRKIDVSDEGVTESRPKWSNPDPYTALPPPPESSGKHVNVLKMIRKARAEPLASQDKVAEQDDFISFGDLGEDPSVAPINAPAGPKADMPYQPRPGERGTDQTLGKRKRGGFDSDTLMGHPSRVQFHANGAILAAWRATQGISPTPWLETPSLTDYPMVALHKEILDFYNWVKPHEFESVVREDLVNRISRELNRWRPGQLKPFGSYAAGLYLPTGDMDLVYTYSGAFSTISKNQMYQAGSFIERAGLAKPRSVQVIAMAKVPIIKFVDSITNLKVDLSFNNNTGVVAIETFRKWQVQYPAMPIIISFIKQFLMIRGLNDNSVGGLGGFATICMVTSLIQNLPTSKPHNLGELLVEFFNLFGNLLDIRTVGIRLDPPGFIDKHRYSLLRDEKLDRMMIIDPNRPDNNITGGSNEILRIMHLFSLTHEALLSRLDDFADTNKRSNNFSFFADLVGGDFEAYHQQRQVLHKVYSRMYPNSGVPPPPPTSAIVDPPPPPPGTTQDGTVHHRSSDDDSVQPTSTADGTAPQNKSEKRLERMKRLCPELMSKLRNRTTIGPNQALKLGGWTSTVTMNRDLTKREQSLHKAQSGQKMGKTAKKPRAKK